MVKCLDEEAGVASVITAVLTDLNDVTALFLAPTDCAAVTDGDVGATEVFDD